MSDTEKKDFVDSMKESMTIITDGYVKIAEAQKMGLDMAKAIISTMPQAMMPPVQPTQPGVQAQPTVQQLIAAQPAAPATDKSSSLAGMMLAGFAILAIIIGAGFYLTKDSSAAPITAPAIVQTTTQNTDPLLQKYVTADGREMNNLEMTRRIGIANGEITPEFMTPAELEYYAHRKIYYQEDQPSFVVNKYFNYTTVAGKSTAKAPQSPTNTNATGAVNQAPAVPTPTGSKIGTDVGACGASGVSNHTGEISATAMADGTTLINCSGLDKKPVKAEYYAGTPGIAITMVDGQVLLPAGVTGFNIVFDDNTYLNIPAGASAIPGITLKGLKINSDYKDANGIVRAKLEVVK